MVKVMICVIFILIIGSLFIEELMKPYYSKRIEKMVKDSAVLYTCAINAYFDGKITRNELDEIKVLYDRVREEAYGNI